MANEDEDEDDPEKVHEQLFGEGGLFAPRPPKPIDERTLDVLQAIDNRLSRWQQETKPTSTREVERELRRIRDGIAAIALAVIFIGTFGFFVTIDVLTGDATTRTELVVYFIISLLFAGSMAKNIERQS